MNGQAVVYETLDRMNIPYREVEHDPVYTVEDMEQLKLQEHGEIVKNLFLRDTKGKRHFLVVLRADKRADLGVLAGKLGSTKLSFASEDRLMKHLGLKKGAVTPFGVLNDSAQAVEVAFDKDLQGKERLGVHPNENTATLFLSFADIEAVIKAHGNTISYIRL